MHYLQGLLVSRRVLLALLPSILFMGCVAQKASVRTMPDVPQIVANASSKSVLISWEADPVAATFDLHWSAESNFPNNSTTVVSNVASPYRQVTPEVGQPYYFYVEAVGPTGERVRSNIASATPFIRDKRLSNYIIIDPQPGDTLSALAEEYLGSPDLAWILSKFNEVDDITVGEPIIIPRSMPTPGGLSTQRYQTIPVLLYHRLSKEGDTRMSVDPDTFKEQMEYLAANGYSTITIKDFYNFMSFRSSVPENAVLITFDDGWSSTFNIAYPILEELDLKATLFVTTGMIDEGAPEAMNWRMLRTLNNSDVFDVECHTVTHRRLERGNGEGLDAYIDAVKFELEESRQRIEEELNRKCMFVAYPYGYTNHLVIAIAKKIGYLGGFTTNRGANPFFYNDFRVFRSMIYGEHDLEYFKTQLSAYGRRALQ